MLLTSSQGQAHNHIYFHIYIYLYHILKYDCIKSHMTFGDFGRGAEVRLVPVPRNTYENSTCTHTHSCTRMHVWVNAPNCQVHSRYSTRTDVIINKTSWSIHLNCRRGKSEELKCAERTVVAPKNIKDI